MKRSELLAQMEDWYNREMAGLYNYIVFRVTDRAAADEILATACERGLKRLHQFDPKKGTFSAWMFGIARNSLNDYFRKDGRQAGQVSIESLPPIQGSGDTLEGQAIQAERFKQVIRQLEQLSESEREAVALRYGSELKYQEIAEIMKVSVDQVGVLLHRALEKLRSALNENDKEEAHENQERIRSI